MRKEFPFTLRYEVDRNRIGCLMGETVRNKNYKPITRPSSQLFCFDPILLYLPDIQRAGVRKPTKGKKYFIKTKSKLGQNLI